jgi:mono/diheme cytochrome c family protein
MKPDTLMPKPGLSPEQARDVAAYLTTAALAPLPAPTVAEPLPNLERRVRYEEVAQAVLDVTCRHCHGNPDDALGDGGPGNTGGLGFRKRGINFTSYEQTQGGYLDDAGERHSLFEAMPDGTPRIVAALWARHREVAGKPDPTIRGMPLGLPPLPVEQIQLVATWVAQGRPR